MKKSKLKHLVLLLVAVLTLPSCGEDEPEPTPTPVPAPSPSPDPEPNPNPLPDTDGKWVITEYSSTESPNDINRLTYDAEGRVIRMDYIVDGEHGTETYEYTPTKITLYEGSGSDRRADWYYDLSSGLVTQEYDDEWVEERYEYNSARQLTARINSECRVDFLWNAGNITQIKQDWKEHPVNCEIFYGDYSEMNSACRVPLNRLAMTMIIGIYPSISLGGFYGEVPARLITGTSDTADGMLNSIYYSNFDTNGCPRTMEVSLNGEEDQPISLKWRQIH